METRVIVVEGMHCPPVQELNQELRKLGDDWHIDSATTSMTSVGDFMDGYKMCYVITAVVSRTAQK